MENTFERGEIMRNARRLAEEMTRAGGFTRFRQVDFEADPMNVFYEVRL